MANVLLLVGDTGTGKSTSIKNLDSKETYIFNVLNKSLPFKGANKLYNRDNKNTTTLNDYANIISTLKTISEKATHIKNVIIDDIGFVMLNEYFSRAGEAGLIY